MSSSGWFSRTFKYNVQFWLIFKDFQVQCPVLADFQGLSSTMSSSGWTFKYNVQFWLIFKDFQVQCPVLADFQGLSSTMSSSGWFSRTFKYNVQCWLIFKDFQVQCPVLADFQGLSSTMSSAGWFSSTVPSFHWFARTAEVPSGAFKTPGRSSTFMSCLSSACAKGMNPL